MTLYDWNGPLACQKVVSVKAVSGVGVILPHFRCNLAVILSAGVWKRKKVPILYFRHFDRSMFSISRSQLGFRFCFYSLLKLLWCNYDSKYHTGHKRELCPSSIACLTLQVPGEIADTEYSQMCINCMYSMLWTCN